MQFSKTLLLLAALTSGSLADLNKRASSTLVPAPSSTSSGIPSASSSPSGGGSWGGTRHRRDGGSWTDTPSDGSFSTEGFGSSTDSGGSGVSYKGNVGQPWGSNMVQVSSSDASKYKNVLQIQGQNTEPWNVVFWNKIGPDGQMTGFFGNSALTFELSPGDTKYVAFADDSQGGFGAAPGSIPTGPSGAWASTWGEFDFKSAGNGGWSGFDVSAIMAQKAGMTVQGMSMCDVLGGTCSSITTNAASVDNAYTEAETAEDGIGGNINGGGGIRLAAVIDYSG